MNENQREKSPYPKKDTIKSVLHEKSPYPPKGEIRYAEKSRINNTN